MEDKREGTFLGPGVFLGPEVIGFLANLNGGQNKI
jgi:hypothetical protein